jgi:hypothetical protein
MNVHFVFLQPLQPVPTNNNLDGQPHSTIITTDLMPTLMPSTAATATAITTRAIMVSVKAMVLEILDSALPQLKPAITDLAISEHQTTITTTMDSHRPLPLLDLGTLGLSSPPHPRPHPNHSKPSHTLVSALFVAFSLSLSLWFESPKHCAQAAIRMNILFQFLNSLH